MSNEAQGNSQETAMTKPATIRSKKLKDVIQELHTLIDKRNELEKQEKGLKAILKEALTPGQHQAGDVIVTLKESTRKYLDSEKVQEVCQQHGIEIATLQKETVSVTISTKRK